MDYISVNLILVLLTAQSKSIGSNSTFPDSMEEDSFNAKLMSIAGLKGADEVLSALGMKDSDSVPLIRIDHEVNYAEQAICEPELKTVEIEQQDVETGEIFFPPSVRVLRCGGCCDLANRMVCTPTKISFRDVVRAKIMMRGLTRSSSSQTIPIEVHEECRCMCRMKEENCDTNTHDYRPDLCKCTCKNEQEYLSCRDMAETKKWSFKECKCKCRKEQHCPTGTVFSHTDCSCEAE